MTKGGIPVNDEHRRMPFENHRTAAWINTHAKKGKGRVSIPSETGVINAKEHVDNNEK